jgi:hypothetical protein
MVNGAFDRVYHLRRSISPAKQGDTMCALLPRAAVLAALSMAAACDAGISDPRDDTLTAAEVQGTYLICTLRFTPVQRALPVADLLARVMEPVPGPGQPAPSISLSGASPEFDLVYVRRGDGALQQLRGDVEFGHTSVFLYPHSQTASQIALEALLPPAHLDLVFHPATRTLTAGDEVSAYYVRRQDYARAAGMSAEGLQERILGHVTAALAPDTCD